MQSTTLHQTLNVFLLLPGSELGIDWAREFITSIQYESSKSSHGHRITNSSKQEFPGRGGHQSLQLAYGRSIDARYSARREGSASE